MTKLTASFMHLMFEICVQIAEHISALVCTNASVIWIYQPQGCAGHRTCQLEIQTIPCLDVVLSSSQIPKS